MNNVSSAFELIKDQYDLDTLKEIVNHGCVSGVATDHIYYNQTTEFFDTYEEEVTEAVTDVLGVEYLVETFKNCNAHLVSYKNDITWTFVELTAQRLIDEFETTMIEYEQECNDQLLSTLSV